MVDLISVKKKICSEIWSEMSWSQYIAILHSKQHSILESIFMNVNSEGEYNHD